jgi:hypothetical protein
MVRIISALRHTSHSATGQIMLSSNSHNLNFW